MLHSFLTTTVPPTVGFAPAMYSVKGNWTFSTGFQEVSVGYITDVTKLETKAGYVYGIKIRLAGGATYTCKRSGFHGPQNGYADFNYLYKACKAAKLYSQCMSIVGCPKSDGTVTEGYFCGLFPEQY